MTSTLQDGITIVILATLQSQPTKEMTLKQLTDTVKTQLRTNERAVRLIIMQMERERQLIRILPALPTLSPLIRLASESDVTAAPPLSTESVEPSADTSIIITESNEETSKLKAERKDMEQLVDIIRRRRIVEVTCDGREVKISYEVVRNRTIRY